MKFKRIWHPVDKWEEMKSGMWADTDNRQNMLQDAIAFTGDHERYGKYMRKVVRSWPISCENALTDYSLNRKAWIGHAACALALGCPEDIVRSAWGMLTDEQRELANRQAANAITIWEQDYARRSGLLRHVGEQMLFEWNTGPGG